MPAANQAAGDILPYLDELGTMGQDQSLEGTADSHAYSTRDPAVIQQSLTGLVRALFATQHCVPGYDQAVPAGLYATKQLSQQDSSILPSRTPSATITW